jgi:cyclin-dependent kinase 12/13
MQQQTHTSSKSNSEVFNQEDSVPGFRVEPRERPTAVQLPGYSSTWNNMEGDNDQPTVPGRACCSVRVANPCGIRKKGSSHSLIPQFGATDLRSTVEATDHNDSPDRHDENKNPEVKDGMVSIALLLLEQILMKSCNSARG